MQYKILLLSFFFLSCMSRSKDNVPALTAKPGTANAAPYVFYQPGQALVPELMDNSVDTAVQVSRHINSILQDNRGYIWFATFDDGVCRYNGTDFVYIKTTEGLAGNTVYNIAEDKKGHLWFATSSGLSRFDGKKFFNYSEKDGLPSADCRSVYADSKGRLWINTIAGTCLFENEQIHSFQLPAGKNESLAQVSTALVTAVTEDLNGNIWFSHDGGGLSIYDGQKITEAEAQQAPVTALMTDTDGKIYAGFQDGSVAIREDNHFRKIYQDEEKNKQPVSSIISGQDGSVYCGTLGGGLLSYEKGNWQTIQEPWVTKNQIRSICIDRSGKLWCGFTGGVYWLKGTKLINLVKRMPGC